MRASWNAGRYSCSRSDHSTAVCVNPGSHGYRRDASCTVQVRAVPTTAIARQSSSQPSCGLPSAKPRLMKLIALGWSPASRAFSSPVAKTAASEAWKLSAPLSRRVLTGSRNSGGENVGGANTNVLSFFCGVGVPDRASRIGAFLRSPAESAVAPSKGKADDPGLIAGGTPRLVVPGADVSRRAADRGGRSAIGRPLRSDHDRMPGGAGRRL